MTAASDVRPGDVFTLRPGENGGGHKATIWRVDGDSCSWQFDTGIHSGMGYTREFLARCEGEGPGAPKAAKKLHRWHIWTLSPADVRDAAIVAAERTRIDVARRFPNHHDEPGVLENIKRRRQTDLTGTRGLCAFSRWGGFPLPKAKDGRPDKRWKGVADRYFPRTTAHYNGRLPVQVDDNPDGLYVFILDDPKTDGDFMLHGWCTGKFAQQPQYWQTRGEAGREGAYWVPPSDLADMCDLPECGSVYRLSRGVDVKADRF